MTSQTPAVFAAPENFIRNAHVNAKRYAETYAASIADPRVSGPRKAGGSTGSRPTPRSRTPTSTFGNVSIKWFEDGTLNVSANCVDRHVATRGNQTAIIWEPDDPKTPARHITYAAAARRRLPDGQRAQGAWRAQGRPGRPLPADDPRGGLRHAGLRADRRDPFDRLRRLLARCAGQPDQRLRSQDRHHRRLRAARRQEDRRSRPIRMRRCCIAATT